MSNRLVSLTQVSTRGRLIKPSTRYTEGNAISNPFGKRLESSSPPASATAIAAASAALRVRAPSPIPPVAMAAEPLNPPVVEMDDPSDEPPPLISWEEVRVKRLLRTQPLNAHRSESGMGWLTSDAYRRGDGVIEIDMEKSPFVGSDWQATSNKTAGWLAPDIYRHSDASLEVFM
jgi:hypothetical protein